MAKSSKKDKPPKYCAYKPLGSNQACGKPLVNCSHNQKYCGNQSIKSSCAYNANKESQSNAYLASLVRPRKTVKLVAVPPPKPVSITEITPRMQHNEYVTKLNRKGTRRVYVGARG